ncbi:hypothetical protein [Streptacidiphilus sp. MAP12-16]|uniref:hypothetical protein n=1 Tax=Streptacidiphilus sp. MAP12-16 TaxID=3156300 RepID=UPI003518EBF4
MANRPAAALVLREGDRGEFERLTRSSMNLVVSWFSIAERQAIHRGTYTSAKDLNAKLRTYIDGWHDRAHPFTWTKTADDILKKANRKKISSAEHWSTTARNKTSRITRH